jgi:hypothetical protein
MERKIILVSILSLVSLLALVALFTGDYGYITASLFGFPILFYTQREVFHKIHWIIMITVLLLVTVASVNLLGNFTGNLLYYYELFGSLIVLILSLVLNTDEAEVKE